MPTVDACISCMNDIDLWKIGQKRKRKDGMNAEGDFFTPHSVS